MISKRFTNKFEKARPDTILPWPLSYWCTPIYVNCYTLCIVYVLILQSNNLDYPAYDKAIIKFKPRTEVVVQQSTHFDGDSDNSMIVITRFREIKL